jgi:hypothetical protein
MEGPLVQRVAGRMRVAFDARYPPLYIITYQGAVTLESAKWLVELANRTFENALRAGQLAVSITDARTIDLPSGELRAYWAEQTVTYKSVMQKMLGTFVVIDKPILRGVLALMTQLFSEVKSVEYVPGLGDAIRIANSRIEAKGQPPVMLEASSYRLPDPR